MRVLVKAHAIRSLSDGDASPVGDIVITPEHSDWAVVEVSGNAAEVRQTLERARVAGHIEAWQPETAMRPLGVITPTSENLMGRDFPVIGLTPEWQAAVDDGADVILGIADTGVPPAAARGTHYPDVVFIEVYGQSEDTHGHETFCVSRMVGPRGALPGCKRVLSAQALPNGYGSTTTVVQAIRALWQHDPQPDVISLSLGGDRDPVIDAEVQAAQAHGVPCSAAVGNAGWAVTDPGSPAAVCRYVWGATTFDGSAPAIFSTGGCNLRIETGALPGENVGGAHLDGGYGLGSGTSFSCPVGSTLVASARRKGWQV